MNQTAKEVEKAQINAIPVLEVPWHKMWHLLPHRDILKVVQLSIILLDLTKHSTLKWKKKDKNWTSRSVENEGTYQVLDENFIFSIQLKLSNMLLKGFGLSFPKSSELSTPLRFRNGSATCNISATC